MCVFCVHEREEGREVLPERNRAGQSSFAAVVDQLAGDEGQHWLQRRGGASSSNWMSGSGLECRSFCAGIDPGAQSERNCAMCNVQSAKLQSTLAHTFEETHVKIYRTSSAGKYELLCAQIAWGDCLGDGLADWRKRKAG